MTLRIIGQSCRSCVHLEVQNDRLGRRIVRADTKYKCTFPLPEVTVVPQWLDHFRNALVINGDRRGMRDVWGDDGVTCSTYEERVK